MKNRIILFSCFMIFVYTKSFSQDVTIVNDSIANNYKNINYAIGKKFCDFETVSLNNDTISNHDLLGKVTMVNLWFEGCAPCIAELGALSKLYYKYKNNSSFQFLSFTVDYFEVARNAVNTYKIPFTVCPVPRELASIMNFKSGFPTNIIINKEGIIVFFKSGGHINIEKVEEDIAQIDEVIAQMLLQIDDK